METLPHRILQLKQKLQLSLPGLPAQMKMAPAIRNFSSNKKYNQIRLSAVLLLLYYKNDDLHIVFIKRPEYDGPHGGQIAFPGGKMEKTDKDLTETALREAYEEIGVDASKLTVLGELTQLYIPVSHSEVHSFVAFSSTQPQFIPDKREVQYVIEIPLNLLFSEQTKTTKLQIRHQMEIATPMYVINNEEIWGATAMITSEFETVYCSTAVEPNR